MKVIAVVAGLVLSLSFSPLLRAAQQCTEVSCDCSAFVEAKWRSLCESQEKTVVADCLANSGKPKSYCGLHGPSAFPVAVSLKTKVSLAGLKESPQELEQQITTQNWSLKDSFNVVKDREVKGKYGDAIQLLSLYERDVNRLYELQKQRLMVETRTGDSTDKTVLANVYAKAVMENAQSVEAYGQQLWDASLLAQDPRTKKATQALSLKAARLAANIYEQGADLYSSGEMYGSAASSWQKAADISRVLIGYEMSTDNNPKIVAFYQAQAAARFNRASFYWLQNKENEALAAASVRDAEKVSQSESTQSRMVDIDNAHDIDTQDIRAMKRPGR